MSSIEIKIKGVKDIKNIKGLKNKGKAQRKKKAIIEKKKGAEYSITKFTPKIIPTYIERPPEQIDYRPIFDKLTNLGNTGLKLFLSQQKSLDNIEQKNIGRPAIFREPSSSVVVSEIMDDDEKKELQKINQEALEDVAISQGKVLDLMEALQSPKKTRTLKDIQTNQKKIKLLKKNNL